MITLEDLTQADLSNEKRKKHLTWDLNNKKPIMQKSGEVHARQREEHVQEPRGGSQLLDFLDSPP